MKSLYFPKVTQVSKMSHLIYYAKDYLIKIYLAVLKKRRFLIYLEIFTSDADITKINRDVYRKQQKTE